MGYEEVKFNYHGKKYSVIAKSLGFFGRFIGLMFSRRKNAKILLFDFKKPTRTAIHSWFVFFPFFAVWIDGGGRVIDICKVKPFSSPISPTEKFVKLVEIPVNVSCQGVVKKISSSLR